MENTKLSFNKRISLVKKEVFDGVTQSKELDNIKGTNTTGYYSLATIERHLHEALIKYDLDLDLEIYEDKVIGHWYDGESDKEREITIDFHRIKDVERLQLMANAVQSEGAVKTYTRRYSLTAILRLPSTDLIDNAGFKGNGQNDKKQGQNNQKQGQNNQKQGQQKKATEGQIKRFYAIASNKKFDVPYLDELVKTAFNLTTKNDLLMSDYKNLTDYMESHSSQETNSMLIKKINKIGKKIPEKK